jgi:hypothetical protein
MGGRIGMLLAGSEHADPFVPRIEDEHGGRLISGSASRRMSRVRSEPATR